MLSIGPVTIDPPLVLAPMAGLTDSPFRRLIRELGGCGLVVSEFLSSEALVRDVEVERRKLRFHPAERPLAIQIYGSRPEAMAEAARAVEDSGAEICDVNMGCPARKVLRGTAGAALMGDLDRATAIIRAVRRSVAIPVTVKLRTGLRPGLERDLELARICEAEGVDAVTLHPRYASEHYGGRANWHRIGRLKEELSIPVIGNGDVVTAEDAQRMLDACGCDGVMIGRAALTRPWIFVEADAALHGERREEIQLAQRARLVRRHLDLLAESYDGQALLHKLKVHTRWFTRGLPGGRSLRQLLSRSDDPVHLRGEIESFLNDVGAAAAAPEDQIVESPLTR
jgi:nifR3 family TIM-barrel protein